MARPEQLHELSPTRWEIPVTYKNGMRVPARIYATRKLLDAMDDGVFEQITNVATLPGILEYAMCMPDGHWGYGFPIGGAAAVDPEEGVISPGGIGFDINCGMRLLRTGLTAAEVRPRLRELVDALFTHVPCGVGAVSSLKIRRDEFRDLIERGGAWCRERGFAAEDDLETTENHGCMPGARASAVSERAIDRGLSQVGTLGSGNHYLEIQVVHPENVFDREIAERFGFTLPDQVAVMFHCGSRGFGHQVATDYLHQFLDIMPKYRLAVPDRELACAPFRSKEGQDYFAAMNCAINMSYVNRQMILHQVREVFSSVFKKSPEELGLAQVYDVAHNTAMLERHTVGGVERTVLMHRKGATRAFGPGNPELPERYRETGQPVILGGSMETGSYLLAGTPGGAETFFSTAHGSGRAMSRTKARKLHDGRTLQRELEHRGIYIRTASFSGLAEEAGDAYKDIDDVVEAVTLTGISKPVIRFTPIGNIKG